MVHNITDKRFIDLLKNKMKGQKLVYIYRILDLIGLCFNKYGIKTDNIEEYDYVIAIQCFVRAIDNNGLVFCSCDINTPVAQNDVAFQTHRELSRFDKDVGLYLENCPSTSLRNIYICTNTSDMELRFENGLSIQISQDTKEEDVEMWRVMKKKTPCCIIRSTERWEFTEGYSLDSWV